MIQLLNPIPCPDDSPILPMPQLSIQAVTSGGGFIVAAQNYGQGSSREHAAMCPMYFGIKAIIAQSFARIHRDNLINFAVLPLTLSNKRSAVGN
ncbi:MAG: hypothetical protein HC825_06870 [Oscillatoriales cyanobacterium RM1_1_9]|nr:hypothetical protein [Oscillatoriales cyanobacterium RM1_1_9]